MLNFQLKKKKKEEDSFTPKVKNKNWARLV